MKPFDEKPDKKIIQDNADQYKQKIAEKLNPPVKIWTGKYNITIQHKASREADKKGYDERCDVRLKGNDPEMEYLFV